MSISAFVRFIFLIRITLEMMADLQLQHFARKAQPGECIKSGFWAWSRHPNYLGELGFWFGLLLFGIAAYPLGWYWQCIGFIAMLAMFLFASIPVMEKRQLERRPNYQEVINSVSKLVPRRPRW
ncbi:MAG: DUF1295 domain-containing protein [Pseudomonadales bacterium]